MQDFRAIFSDLISLFANIQPHDVVDILLLSLVFFLLLNMIRQSRSQVALRGMIIVLVTASLLYLATLVADLSAMKAFMDRAWVVIVLMFLIVFQSEFKKGLTEYGRLPIFRALFRQERTPIEEIIKAASRLAEKQVGALICIERRTSLRTIAETGTPLDAVVSAELLRTIFSMYTPLHDGAVLIRSNRIAAAGCLLPLTNQSLSSDLGTRHRAAVGLAEESDAVVIVVSEETGIISLAVDSAIQRPETPETLRHKLRELLAVDEEDFDGDNE